MSNQVQRKGLTRQSTCVYYTYLLIEEGGGDISHDEEG